MEELEFLITSDYLLADELFFEHLRHVTRNSGDEGFQQFVNYSFKELGCFMKYISDNGPDIWQKQKLENGSECLTVTFEQTTAYAIPQKELSPATKELLNNQKVEASTLKYKQEISLIITTPKIDFGNTWTFFSHHAEGVIKDITVGVVAGLAVKGLTAICSAIVKGIAAKLTASGLMAAAQAGMAVGLKGLAIKFVGFIAGASLAAAALAFIIKLAALLVIAFIIYLIIDAFIFQTYKAYLMVFNITDKDLIFKIPYLYNASDNTQPDPDEVNKLEVKLKKITAPGEFIALDGIPVKLKERAVSVATLEIENRNTFMQGLGWVVRLDNPGNEGFSNIIGTLSIPRFTGASISTTFNYMGTNFEEYFNVESGKFQQGEVHTWYDRYTGFLTSREQSTSKGYDYYCNFIIADKEKYNFHI